jgi:uncharacterized small protein (DUF1192 family)
MVKAVGHHQTLSNQVAALTEEKMRLKAQRRTGMKQLDTRTMEARLQDELEKAKRELDHICSILRNEMPIIESRLTLILAALKKK